MRWWASCKAEVNGEPAEVSIAFDDKWPGVVLRVTLEGRPQRDFDVACANMSAANFADLVKGINSLPEDVIERMKSRERGNG